jgi:AraC family transcriptional regulator
MSQIQYRANTGALDWRRLQRVLAFIEQHLQEPLSLGELCAQACLSKFHFARAFRLAVGVSPQRYVRARRLRMAKSLLLEGRESLANIAFTCHFSSQANFSRAFRSATGITPGRYRQIGHPALSVSPSPQPVECAHDDFHTAIGAAWNPQSVGIQS